MNCFAVIAIDQDYDYVQALMCHGVFGTHKQAEEHRLKLEQNQIDTKYICYATILSRQ